MVSPHIVSGDEQWEAYLFAAGEIEEDLKQFLSKYHQELKRLDLSKFIPQGFDFRLKQDHLNSEGFLELISHEKNITDEKNITEFNRKFIALFKHILFFNEYTQRLPHDFGDGDLLWLGLLEAEDLNVYYSLFCFTERMGNSESFFKLHRLYDSLDDVLFSLTDFFLRKIPQEEEDRVTFRPFYISISRDDVVSDWKFCGDFERNIEEVFGDVPPDEFVRFDSGYREFCSAFRGLNPDDELTLERLNRCLQCVKAKEVSHRPVYCQYTPYRLSDGVTLSNAFVQRVDSLISSPNTLEILKRMDIDAARLRKIINEVYDGVLVAFPGIVEEVEYDRVFTQHIRPDKLNKYLSRILRKYQLIREQFLKYLIWLRTVGLAGEAGNYLENWSDYFYFPMPDLSSDYLHGITVALKDRINPKFFYLIDRHAQKLFQRSKIRLVRKQLGAQEQTFSASIAHGLKNAYLPVDKSIGKIHSNIRLLEDTNLENKETEIQRLLEVSAITKLFSAVTLSRIQWLYGNQESFQGGDKVPLPIVIYKAIYYGTFIGLVSWQGGDIREKLPLIKANDKLLYLRPVFFINGKPIAAKMDWFESHVFRMNGIEPEQVERVYPDQTIDTRLSAYAKLQPEGESRTNRSIGTFIEFLRDMFDSSKNDKLSKVAKKRIGDGSAVFDYKYKGGNANKLHFILEELICNFVKHSEVNLVTGYRFLNLNILLRPDDSQPQYIEFQLSHNAKRSTDNDQRLKQFGGLDAASSMIESVVVGSKKGIVAERRMPDATNTEFYFEFHVPVEESP